MPRPKVEINLVEMQKILDKEKDAFRGSFTEYYKYCSSLYNENFRPAKEVNAPLIYLRVKNNELTINFPTSSDNRARKELSPEHKEKLLQGRKNGRRSRKNTNERHARELTNYLPNKPNLVKAVLKGNPVAAIKAFCIICQGGETKHIRNCDSFRCPLWNMRPYQKEDTD